MIEPIEVYNNAVDAAETILERFPEGYDPKLMIILGSGCGGIAESMERLETIPYSEISGMPQSKVPQHKMELILGKYGGKDVLGFSGRIHCYAGHVGQEAAFPVYLAHLLGAESALMTSAAGIAPDDKRGGDKRYPIKNGELVHIISPYPGFHETSLRGSVEGMPGSRFNPMMNAPSIALGEYAQQVAEHNGIKLAEAVYVQIYSWMV